MLIRTNYLNKKEKRKEFLLNSNRPLKLTSWFIKLLAKYLNSKIKINHN